MSRLLPKAQRQEGAASLPNGRRRSLHAVNNNIYWTFCVPALFVLFVILGAPILYTAWLSTFDFNLFGGTNEFVGWQNYATAISDPNFHLAIGRTIIYIVVTGFFDLTLGLVMAFLVWTLPKRAKSWVRGFFLLPILLIPSAAAVFWSVVMYGPPFQQVNRLLGIDLSTPILGTTSLALIGIMLTVIWAWSPWSFILLSSGLEALNPDPIEAAIVEGAGFMQLVRYVALPMLRPIIFVTVVFKAVASLNTFAFPWAMTQGGPAGSSHVFATYIYEQAFGLLDYGYGAAMSIVMLIIGLAAAVLAARRASRIGYV